MTSLAQPDRAQCVAELVAGRDAFQNAVAELSEEQACFKPSPERWSIEEIVEHVAVAEYGMYRFIHDIHEVSVDPHSAESATSLARASDRKNQPLTAPERACPKRRFEGLKAALDKFLENRERTIGFVQNCRDDLRLRIIRHPIGLLNGD
jgi:hypothetical protein